MQDYTFLDDYDYTFCGNCRSSIQPYDNTSITTITSSITKTTEKDETTTEMTTIKVTKQILSSTNSFTELLIKYHHLHCQKCGLYIEIHPKYDDDTSSKIFICSNSDNNNPHKYCLCYHCGLLYGINPNQKSIDIINILQHKIGMLSIYANNRLFLRVRYLISSIIYNIIINTLFIFSIVHYFCVIPFQFVSKSISISL